MAALPALLMIDSALGQVVTLFDRITPSSGAANALVEGRNPITVNSVPYEGYAATIEFRSPAAPGTLSQVRVAYAGLPNSQFQNWTLRIMVWSSFAAASAGLPASTAAMYNGDIVTLSIPGSQALFAPFGTHSFGGPIYDAVIDLTPYSIRPAANSNCIIGFAVLNAGDAGILETGQSGGADRGLSPYYSGTGWRFMNTFPGLETGRYAVALRMALDPPVACSIADITGVGGPPAAPDGALTGDDFVAFVNAFANSESIADVCGIGGAGIPPDGLVTGDDFIAFISAFAAACS